jgi:hypothetical protein
MSNPDTQSPGTVAIDDPVVQSRATEPGAVSPHAASPSPARRGWSRASSIWLLVGLCLLPGFVAAVDRAWWAALPAAVRLTSYASSAVLFVVLCVLIMRPEDDTGAKKA